MVWILFYRSLGIVFCAVFTNLALQIVPLLGKRGIAPVKPTLKRIQEDIPSPLRFLFFPTLFWCFSSDFCLRGVVFTGLISAISIVFGVFPSFFPALPMLVCYMVYLSWTNSQSEVIAYPWESLLCEVSGLALLLHPASPPSPYVGWLFRWLVFRLMFGFGKKKFAWGSQWYKHTMFIREFFVNNPSPTPSALFLHQNLPSWGFPPFLYGMFLTEIIIPFMFFLDQPYCGIGGIATIGLMGGIQLGGNFGHFNILTSVLCIPLLDGLFSPAQSTDAVAATSFQMVCFYLSFISGLAHLPFDSFTDRPMFSLFCVMGWLRKEDSTLETQPIASNAFTRAAVVLFSCVKSFKVSNAYGVFHTETRAPVRQVCVFEGTRDGGKTWHEYQHFQSAPHFKFIAPLQPFLGYAMFYYGAGFPSCVHLYPLAQILPWSQVRRTNCPHTFMHYTHPFMHCTYPDPRDSATSGVPTAFAHGV
jgi:hypothetical protein